MPSSKPSITASGNGDLHNKPELDNTPIYGPVISEPAAKPSRMDGGIRAWSTGVLSSVTAILEDRLRLI